MVYAQIFEAIMLLCFGFSWPLNVIKAYKARTAKGTSLAFIILIITGYVAGITAKFINGQINYVLAVYFANLAIVMLNVVVYFRNVSLDKKKQNQVTKAKLYELQQKYKNNTNSMAKDSKEENMNYQELNSIAKLNQVVLLGGSFDKEIPVTELAQSFEFNFELYNRSADHLSVRNAKEYFDQNVAAIKPEAMIIHLGAEDITMFQNSASDFDKYYMDLVSALKASNKKMRIALVSVNNTEKNETIGKMNNHIRAISDSYKCTFVNLDNAKLWNPQASKVSVSFAYNMGLNVRKPVNDVAEILYSYACLELKDTVKNEIMAG